jgi:dipeptidyl aminopeptidase/acylaminoacyl peptidase
MAGSILAKPRPALPLFALLAVAGCSSPKQPPKQATPPATLRRLWTSPGVPGMTLQLGGAFSPDGSRVALATDAGEKDKPNWQIWVVEKKVKVCLAESHVDSQPAWSPLDQEIAYLVTAATPELAILDSETGASRVLKLPGIGFEQPPRWSPDGRTIALSHGARSVRILLVNAGDGRVRLLPAKGFLPTVDDSPVWSGDGQRLLLLSYDRLLGDQQALWMADVLRGSAR